MRSDLLLERKCLHVKLPKDAHLALRKETLTRNISIQETVSEFAEAVARGDGWAMRLLDRVAAQKLKRAFDAAEHTHPVDAGRKLGGLDGEAIYKLIQSMRDG